MGEVQASGDTRLTRRSVLRCSLATAAVVTARPVLAQQMQTHLPPGVASKPKMTRRSDFPDDETLVRYLAVLEDVLVDARFRTYSSDLQVAALLDAVHNLPNLLTRWSEAKPEYILSDLQEYEKTYLGRDPRYTRTLREGVEPIPRGKSGA
jgi:hypothetical protein